MKRETFEYYATIFKYTRNTRWRHLYIKIIINCVCCLISLVFNVSYSYFKFQNIYGINNININKNIYKMKQYH